MYDHEYDKMPLGLHYALTFSYETHTFDIRLLNLYANSSKTSHLPENVFKFSRQKFSRQKFSRQKFSCQNISPRKFYSSLGTYIPGNTNGGSITVPLTSCLTGLD
jgi:hypothetical protein